jgi:hypothetical protein
LRLVAPTEPVARAELVTAPEAIAVLVTAPVAMAELVTDADPSAPLVTAPEAMAVEVTAPEARAELPTAPDAILPEMTALDARAPDPTAPLMMAAASTEELPIAGGRLLPTATIAVPLLLMKISAASLLSVGLEALVWSAVAETAGSHQTY